MYTRLNDFLQRPAPHSRFTARELWTRPHLARQMLSYHLDQTNELASRPSAAINEIASWLDDRINLAGKAVCDLGCGPGLYAERFAERGAQVTGVDLSLHSLEYARAESARNGSDIRYLHADYLSDALPDGFDLVTMIYYDYGALSPAQRNVLLTNMHAMLLPGGAVALDVLGMGSLSARSEQTVLECSLMDGFWADGDYIGLQRTLLYPEEAVTLDRYLIIEPGEEWEMFNWLQYFTPALLAKEFEDAGFTIDTLAGSLAGEPLVEDGSTLAIVATK